MKKSVDLTVGDKTYSLCFTIKALSELERLEGRSLILMFETLRGNPAGFMNLAKIDFFAHALKVGISDKPKDFDPYDFIDDYCSQGGKSIEDLFQRILKGILESGLFIKDSPENQEEIIKHLTGLG